MGSYKDNGEPGPYVAHVKNVNISVEIFESNLYVNKAGEWIPAGEDAVKTYTGTVNNDTDTGGNKTNYTLNVRSRHPNIYVHNGNTWAQAEELKTQSFDTGIKTYNCSCGAGCNIVCKDSASGRGASCSDSCTDVCISCTGVCKQNCTAECKNSTTCMSGNVIGCNSSNCMAQCGSCGSVCSSSCGNNCAGMCKISCSTQCNNGCSDGCASCSAECNFSCSSTNSVGTNVTVDIQYYKSTFYANKGGTTPYN